MAEKKKKWIQKADLEKGALHKDLGIPEGEKIPLEALRRAAKSKDKTIAKRARLALTMRGFKHESKKETSPKEARKKLYGSKE